MAEDNYNPSKSSRFGILNNNHLDVQESRKKSKTWYNQQVLLLRRKRYTPQQVIKDDPAQLEARALPGRLYLFGYNPETRVKLPYYDLFPLVFPFRIVSDGFYGLNLHYIPYDIRMRMLDRLLPLANNQRLDESTRLKLTWKVIDASSKFKPLIPCVKHYKKQNVKTLYKKIPPQDWTTAMLLPIERFRKAPVQEVWAESRKIGKY